MEFDSLEKPTDGGRMFVAIEGRDYGDRSYDNIAVTKHNLHVITSDDSTPFNKLHLVSSPLSFCKSFSHVFEI